MEKETATRVASSRPGIKERNSQVDLLPIPSSYPRYFNIGYGNKLRIDVKAASLAPCSGSTARKPLPLVPSCVPVLEQCLFFTLALSLSLSLPLSFTLYSILPPFSPPPPSFCLVRDVHVNRRGNIITLNDTRYEHVTSALHEIPGR